MAEFQSMWARPEASGFEPGPTQSERGEFQPLWGASPPDHADPVDEPESGPRSESSLPPAPSASPAPAPDDEALEQAREEGRQQAREAAADELQALHDRVEELEGEQEQLADALAALPGLRRQALEQAARDVGDLVVHLSYRAIGRSLALHPEALPRIAEKAIASLPRDESVRVRVPVGMEGRVGVLVGRQGVEVHADPDLAGGCIVESRHASIESSLETIATGIDDAVDRWLAGHPVPESGRGESG